MNDLLLSEVKSEKNLTPAMKQYFDLKKIHNNSLLFFRMGDFYELFFNDAILAAEELNITLTKRGKVDDKEIPMCGVPFHAVENYLARLIKKGFSVAICEQTETPENMKVKGLKGPLKREVVRVITPGTIVEENLLESKTFNFLGSLFVDKNNFSISWVDVSTGLFLTNNFICSNQDELKYKIEDVLTRIYFSELLLEKDFNMDLISNQLRTIVKFLDKNLFSYANNFIELKELYPYQKQSFFEQFSMSQIISSGILINYLKKSFCGNLPKLKELTFEKNRSFMEIDKTTLNSLEIITKSSGEKKGSLIDVIDNTITPSGGRLLKQRLISPSCEVEEIERRLCLADYFVHNKSNLLILISYLKDLSDVERNLTRISIHKSNYKELHSIGKFLVVSDKVIKEILDKNLKNTSISKLFKNLKSDNNLGYEIVNAIKEDLYGKKETESFVKEGYNKELDKLKTTKSQSSQTILSLQNKYIKITSINSLKIKFNKVLGYHLEIRSIHIKKMNSFDQFIHRQTTAQASRYTTNELLDLEKEIFEAEMRISEVEKEIYEKFRKKTLIKRNMIMHLSDIISELDIAIMTANQKINKNYVRPKILKQKHFVIEDGRHPVIESLSNFALNDFVPNNCNLCKNNVWLITGPNMAGKSTFLRQNALIAILAQSGFYVPAKKVEIGIIDKMFSRVGASDDISKGESTFMVEMLETASILKRATEKSFIIFDEVGRGTATFDGLAIAWAVLEFLINEIKSRVLFATHYHELTSLKTKFKEINNYKMNIREWNDQISFLYKVVEGEADKSYGVEVAKLAGFPEKLILRANKILYELENKNYNIPKNNKKSVLSEEKQNLNNLEDILTRIEPNNLTPLEALKTIYNLKEKINNLKRK